ncbi:MAG: error-prone DNA polymerase [Pseudomonadales bacterium]|nr:error-prone DNA polymerase [Pseudomonadales bacterium]
MAGYAELHCLTHFSFLRSAADPERLAERAKALGYAALAVTDECSVAGAVRMHQACQAEGLKLIVGSEFTLEEGPKIVLLAPDRTSYGALCSLITQARRRCEKGHYRLSLRDLTAQRTAQSLALWLPDPTRSMETQRPWGEALKTAFPERLWLALGCFDEGDDLARYHEAYALGQALALPLTAAGDVRLVTPEDKPLHDVLTAIRLGHPVASLGSALHSNGERHLQPWATLRRRYPSELLAETLRIADRCHFSLAQLRYEYPEELVPPGQTPSSHLRSLTFAGAAERWPSGIPDSVTRQLEHELTLIEALGYEYFFLTVYDIVAFARSKGILCQGRGSAANSAVCYCLAITEVDPSQSQLLFERFISKERNEPPDIDVDFEHQRREEVIQYIYRKYGRDRAALAATVIAYRLRSALRDVGKALGFEAAFIEKLARQARGWERSRGLPELFSACGADPTAPALRRYQALVTQLLGVPRHLSQHVGGFVISRGPLAELVPVENASMTERTVIQWDKDDLEALGLLKVDVLALGMLSALRRSLELLAPLREGPRSLADIPREDPDTYAMLQRGDALGVFQVESRAQLAMLPRLKPACFYDLVVEVAIVRPGPIQGDMVHPFLRRRQGLEAVHYPNTAVREVLERTLGVPIFQEQVIKLAMVAAGFSGGEADALRRAMAAWKRQGGLSHFRDKLLQGMRERGHDEAFAERLFAQIQGFGEYGFPESHAASFAVLVYCSAWLKRHEPAAFYAGLLNSLPMGFYSADQLLQDARRHGLEIRPVDVQCSHWDYTLEPSPQSPGPGQRGPGPWHYDYASPQAALRMGLRQIKGLQRNSAERLIQAREAGGPFKSLPELRRRAQLDAGSLRCLAQGDALQALTGHRHQSHWARAALLPATPLLGDEDPRDEVSLRPPRLAESLQADYENLGTTLRPHPLALLRSRPRFQNLPRAEDLRSLRNGRFLRLAGIVTGRQRPGTASGVLFLTLEDETGFINVIVWPQVLERFRAVVLGASLLYVKGVLQREGEVIHVVGGAFFDESAQLADLPLRARDFH